MIECLSCLKLSSLHEVKMCSSECLEALPSKLRDLLDLANDMNAVEAKTLWRDARDHARSRGE